MCAQRQTPFLGKCARMGIRRASENANGQMKVHEVCKTYETTTN
jgi:hypothetical protein